MKRLALFNLIAVLLLLLLVSENNAQGRMKWEGGGSWGSGTSYGRMFNPKTVETIRGEVVSADFITPLKGMSNGVHLLLKTEGETLSVHLGPEWYISRQEPGIEPKDEIEVTGSRITFEGKPAIIASELKKGDDVLVLRDSNGIPVWSGWRRRQ
jgi:hypothetical protein